MELNELKKTWNKISSGKELDENQLSDLLRKRTSSLIEKIDRNIKYGFIILLAIFAFFTFNEIWYSPGTIEQHHPETPIPDWLTLQATLCNFLILAIFFYFLFKYFLLKRNCRIACNLKDTLKLYIGTLVLYQRLFYLALAAILIEIGSAFISGIIIGTEYKAEMQGIQISDIETGKLLLIILITAGFLALVGGSIFFFLRWGFRRLYGNYIKKLKITLIELEEAEE